MNSKLREALAGFYTKIYWDMRKGNGQPPLIEDYAKYEAEAEKAIRQAVGEDMLELVGEGEVHVSHVCPQDSIPCAKFAARGALRHELRQKIKQWQGGEDA